MHSSKSSFILGSTILIGLTVASCPTVAQGPGQGPSPVRYTAALNHAIRGAVHLPGSVESRTASVVAAEAAGLVVAMDVDEGDRVNSGKSLVRLRTINYELQLQAAQGQLKEAQARLRLAESKLRRARELFEDEVISEDQLDDAFFEFTAWQGRVDASQATIAELEVYLKRCVVRAPFDGVVVAKLTDVGQWMDAGGDVVEMVAVDRLDVRVEVPERYYRQLDTNVAAAVTFEALPELEVAGELHRVIPRADPQARTFPIKIRIPNPDRKIGVGMLARVSLPVGAIYDAVLVPKDAIVRQGPQEIVYRIKEDQTVEPVPVVPGQGVGVWIEVQGPLAPGDRVVTRGNERVFPGMPVAGEAQEYPQP
jgi:RND family efflux transporter MFP subunit